MNLDKFRERMEEIKEAHNYTPEDLENATNIKNSEYTPKIKNREELETKIEFVARWFDISPAYLKGDDDERISYTDYVLKESKK